MFFKVVEKLYGNYWSASHFYMNENFDYSINYKIGKFVKPNLPASKLFVFNNIVCAKDFAQCTGQHVFKVEVINPVESSFRLIPKISGNLEKYWRTGFILPNQGSYLVAPDGTVLCDEVKLLEEV